MDVILRIRHEFSNQFAKKLVDVLSERAQRRETNVLVHGGKHMDELAESEGPAGKAVVSNTATGSEHGRSTGGRSQDETKTSPSRAKGTQRQQAAQLRNLEIAKDLLRTLSRPGVDSVESEVEYIRKTHDGSPTETYFRLTPRVLKGHRVSIASIPRSVRPYLSKNGHGLVEFDISACNFTALVGIGRLVGLENEIPDLILARRRHPPFPVQSIATFKRLSSVSLCQENVDDSFHPFYRHLHEQASRVCKGLCDQCEDARVILSLIQSKNDSNYHGKFVSSIVSAVEAWCVELVIAYLEESNSEYCDFVGIVGDAVFVDAKGKITQDDVDRVAKEVTDHVNRVTSGLDVSTLFRTTKECIEGSDSFEFVIKGTLHDVILDDVPERQSSDGFYDSYLGLTFIPEPSDFCMQLGGQVNSATLFPAKMAKGIAASETPGVLDALSVVQAYLDYFCVRSDKEEGIKSIDGALKKLIFFKTFAIFNWFGCLFLDERDGESCPRRLYINGNTALSDNPVLLFSRPIDEHDPSTYERVFYNGPVLHSVYTRFVNTLVPWEWFRLMKCFPTEPVNMAVVRSVFFGQNSERMLSFPYVFPSGRRPMRVGLRDQVITIDSTSVEDSKGSHRKSDVYVDSWKVTSNDVSVLASHFFDVSQASINVDWTREHCLRAIKDGRIPLVWPIVKIVASQLLRHRSDTAESPCFNENSKLAWNKLTRAEWKCIEFVMGCLGVVLGVYIDCPFFLFIAGAPGVGKTVLASWVTRLLGSSNVFNFDVSDSSKHAMSGIMTVESDGRNVLKPVVNFKDLQEKHQIPPGHSGAILSLLDMDSGTVAIDRKFVQSMDVEKDGPIRGLACANATPHAVFPGNHSAFRRRSVYLAFPYEIDHSQGAPPDDALRNPEISAACLLACLCQAEQLSSRTKGPDPPPLPRIFEEMCRHFENTVETSLNNWVYAWWRDCIQVHTKETVARIQSANQVEVRIVPTLSIDMMWSGGPYDFCNYLKQNCASLSRERDKLFRKFGSIIENDIAMLSNNTVKKKLARSIVCVNCRRCYGFKNPWDQIDKINTLEAALAYWSKGNDKIPCPNGESCSLRTERSVILRTSFKM